MNNVVISAPIKSINPKINKFENPGNPFNQNNPEPDNLRVIFYLTLQNL